jgi:small subunit ribosomal protein S8
MNYLISDFVTRIKNAVLAKRKKVTLPYSRMVSAVGRVLVKEGFLKDLKVEDEEGKKSLVAEIVYEKRIPVFSDVLIVSKPSLRVYIRRTEIKSAERKGMHKLILSTNKGIMTGKEAGKLGLGGELLFEIW